MSRTLAVVLAVIALLLAILGGAAVLSSDAPPAPGGPAGTGSDTSAGGRRRAEPPARPVVPQRPTEADAPPPLAPLAPLPDRLPLPRGDGFVVGTVIDALSHDPVRDVTVRLVHPTGEAIDAAITDHAGRYQLDGVPRSVPLLLLFSHGGHLDGACCDVSVDSDSIVRKDVTLLHAPRVHVTTTAQPWARAQSGVRVRVMDGVRVVAEGVTDEFGEADLSVPEMGRFMLRVGGGEWAQVPDSELDLLPGARDARRAVDVRRGGMLAVAVERDGDAVSGSTVRVLGVGLETAEATTDPDGLASLGPFPPGVSLTAVATDAAGRTARADTVVQDNHETDVVLALGAPSAVAGQVEDRGRRALANARVVLRLPDGLEIARTTTDDAGHFAVDGLPDGELLAEIEAPGHEALSLVLGAGARSGETFRLRDAPSARVEGRVRRDDGGDVGDLPLILQPCGLRTTTDDRGRFAFEGVPITTPQRIAVASPGAGLTVASHEAATVPPLGEGRRHTADLVVTRVGTEPDSATAATEPGLLRLVGRVVTRRGRPVEAAIVVCGDVLAVTDADGAFTIEHPAGAPGLPAALRVQPPEGLLEPLTLAPLAPDTEGVAAVGDVVLLDRPTSLIRLARAPSGEDRAQSVSLLLDGDDYVLGSLTPAWEGARRVSYDGHWLHVAAPGSWRSAGRRHAWIGVVGPFGPLVADAEWRVIPGAAQSGAPDWTTHATRADVRLGKRKYVGAIGTLRWEEPPEGVPIERLGLTTDVRFEIVGHRLALAPLARGTWTLTLDAGRTDSARFRIEDGRVTEESK